jgi:hypothetical protein
MTKPEAVTLPGLTLSDTPPEDVNEGELVVAARATIAALREQNALQAWHELDAAIVLETAKGVLSQRGIAKSQMVTALLQARAKLPEPVVHETDEVLQYEADRDYEWIERHGDPAHIPNGPEPAPVL